MPTVIGRYIVNSSILNNDNAIHLDRPQMTAMAGHVRSRERSLDRRQRAEQHLLIKTYGIGGPDTSTCDTSAVLSPQAFIIVT
jgi:hypothetical protein